MQYIFHFRLTHSMVTQIEGEESSVRGVIPIQWLLKLKGGNSSDTRFFWLNVIQKPWYNGNKVDRVSESAADKNFLRL